MVNKKRISTRSVRVIREPFPIVSVEKSSFKETYGGAEDIVMVFCTLIRTEQPSETCLVTMHPIGGTGWLPVMSSFAHAGIHVLACDSRYRGADYALNMEKVTVDLGSCMRHAREVLGWLFHLHDQIALGKYCRRRVDNSRASSDIVFI